MYVVVNKKKKKKVTLGPVKYLVETKSVGSIAASMRGEWNMTHMVTGTQFLFHLNNLVLNFT